MSLEEAKLIAERVKKALTPYCEKVEIAGSIRRSKPIVHDIDMVMIPKPEAAFKGGGPRWMIDSLMASLGTVELSGPKIKRLRLTEENITIDIYLATPLTWSTLLLIRTGSKENNIRLCSLARRKGWQLKANGDGLFDEDGNRVAGDTEQSIYEALAIPYQEPEERS